MRHKLPLLALVFSAACNWGTRPDTFTLANHPEGARVAARVKGETVDRVGELLTADSLGVVLRGDRVVRITWTRLDALDVDGLGRAYDVLQGERVGRDKIAKLALVSRFPQGIASLPITLDSLIALAFDPTRRYADRSVAVDDGYRRVGADFPAMGEHWVNVAALRASAIDPARPGLLIYATIQGAPRLLGVGYVAITRGDARPTDAPGWPEAWHEHSGLLADESGAAPADSRAGNGDTHFWVMHVWTSLANPDGATVADNWALPYVRAGVPAPRPLDADAAHAMSLSVGGDAFLSDLLSDAGLRTAANAGAVDAAIADARGRISAARASSASIDGGEWRRLVTRLEQLVGPRVRPLMATGHHHP
jgi:hypothetical protein